MGTTTYAQYCTRRGYKPPFRGWPVVRRSLLESWAQPGFHRFWRVWNPPIGYLLFLLYRTLGGNRNRLVATLAVFTVIGALHDLALVALVRRFSLVLTCAYFGFACLSLLSLKLAPIVRQDRWPAAVNVVVNVGLIFGTFQASRSIYWQLAEGRS
jgi:hypothetical protein